MNILSDKSKITEIFWWCWSFFIQFILGFKRRKRRYRSEHILNEKREYTDNTQSDIESILSIAPTEVEREEFLKQLWELDKWKGTSIENTIQETRFDINNLFSSLQVDNINMKNIPETEKRKINWATAFAKKARQLWTITDKEKKIWIASYYRKANKEKSW